MKIALYICLALSLALNLTLWCLLSPDTLSPFVPLVTAAFSIIGALLVARFIAAEWQQRVGEKQMYTQIVIAEWNHEAASWRDQSKDQNFNQPLIPLRERLIASGVLRRNPPIKK